MTFSYLIIDNQKREHKAKDRAEVGAIISQLSKKFGDKLKVKIRAVPVMETAA